MSRRQASCGAALAAWMVVAGAMPARATEAQAIDVGSAFTLRLQFPFTQVVVWRSAHARDGGIAQVGGSLSRRFRNLFEVEAGIANIINPCASGTLGTLRAGLTPSLTNPSRSGTHWNVRLPLLASAHAAWMSRDGCDSVSDPSGRVITLAGGVDATYWGSSVLGINLRLLAGVGTDGISEGSLSLGYAFQ